MRERRHQNQVAILDLPVGYRVVQVDRDARTEKVAALVKSVPMTFLGQLPGFAPIAQKHPVGLVGDQQIDVLFCTCSAATGLAFQPEAHLGQFGISQALFTIS